MQLKTESIELQATVQERIEDALVDRLPYSRYQWKSSLKTVIKWEHFFLFFFEWTLKDNLTTKNGDTSSSTP